MSLQIAFTFFNSFSQYSSLLKVKVKTILVQVWTVPEGSRRIRFPEFTDIRHMKVTKLSVLHTAHLYVYEILMVLLSFRDRVDPLSIIPYLDVTVSSHSYSLNFSSQTDIRHQLCSARLLTEKVLYRKLMARGSPLEYSSSFDICLTVYHLYK